MTCYMNDSSTTLLTARHYGFPQCVKEPFWLFDNDAALKAHPRYQDAKAGGEDAAVELVSDVALDFLVSIKEKLPSDAVYIAPHAREATGDNAIPQVLATASAIVAQGEVETDSTSYQSVSYRCRSVFSETVSNVSGESVFIAYINIHVMIGKLNVLHEIVGLVV